MKYIHKKVFKISDLAELENQLRKIVIISEDKALAEVYSNFLEDSNYSIHISGFSDISVLTNKISTSDLMVIDFSGVDYDSKIDFAFSVSKHFPALPIVSIGLHLHPDHLSVIMDFGAVGHIDRKFSKVQDIGHILKTILINHNKYV